MSKAGVLVTMALWVAFLVIAVFSGWKVMSIIGTLAILTLFIFFIWTPDEEEESQDSHTNRSA